MVHYYDDPDLFVRHLGGSDADGGHEGGSGTNDGGGHTGGGGGPSGPGSTKIR